METFNIKIAELKIRIHAKSKYLSRFCAKYIIPDEEKTDFEIEATDEEIDEAIRLSGLNERHNAEVAAIYTNISRVLPLYNAVMVHGATISYRDEAYIFTAKSGVGKSTLLKIMAQIDKEINGYKPIIREINGKLYACGTPWCGKEGWNENTICPLKAICILERGEKNSIIKVAPNESINSLSWQIFIPKEKNSALKTLEIYDKILTEHPIYKLSCTISEEAVRVAFEGMTGEKYIKKEANK